MRDLWNQRFAQEGWAYGKRPNVYLKSCIEKLTPTLACFPADGEGRNAVWAASKGWECTVFDYAEEGAKKCKILAEEKNVHVKYIVEDLQSIELEVTDLIACSWFHTPPEVRKIHMPRILHSLRVGGHFIMEGYHKNQLGKKSGGPQNFDLLFDLDEVLAELRGDLAPQMEVIEACVTECVLDESELHRGLASVVRIWLKRTG